MSASTCVGGRSLVHSLQFGLCLLQPQRHVHVLVHRARGEEALAGARARPRSAVELAKAEVAVSGERPHPDLLGERERVTIVGLSERRLIATGGDLAEEPERL